MPRPIVLGNGALLVCFDEALNVRDLYFPYVGLQNHLSGNKLRTGIWVDGRFAWFDDAGWTRRLAYRPGTLTSQCEMDHPGLQLSLRITDCVAVHDNLLLRRLKIHNHAEMPREVRVFTSHNFCLAETDIGDTALYNPYLQAVMHYKRDCWLLIGGLGPEEGIWQYTCGIKGFGGAEGTWRDCEDGWLEGHPIEQGSVDSSIAFRLHIEPNQDAELDWWLAAGRSLDEVSALHLRVHERTLSALVELSSTFWRSWSRRGLSLVDKHCPDFEEPIRRSLLIIRTQIDNRGAIIAANDTDIMSTARAHYSYMWPRDGALVAHTLDQLGHIELTQRFFQFCARLLPEWQPMLLHKYAADGTLGASWHPWIADGQPQVPFQEDGTASVIWALWHHYERHHDIEFCSGLYERFIQPAADFMASYRDPETGLPLDSWDLWEERRGTHAWTCGAVFGGLTAAARFARLLGDDERRARWTLAAHAIRDGIYTWLWRPDAGHFARTLRRRNQDIEADTTVDSSIAGLFLFDAIPADDPCMVKSMQAVAERLQITTPIGGIGRYEHDYYHRKREDQPGNPWIICTLWLADHRIATARTAEMLKEVYPMLQWVLERSLPTGVMPEQMHPTTGEPLSVAPLTWSHAQFVDSVLRYVHRMDELSG